jgi:hypothetical protein
MPCRDYEEDCSVSYSESQYKSLELLKQKAHERADEVAQVACTVFNAIRGICIGRDIDMKLLLCNSVHGKTEEEIDQALTWWKAHEISDTIVTRKRLEAIRKEELRNQALSKLTNEEREALGLIAV